MNGRFNFSFNVLIGLCIAAALLVGFTATTAAPAVTCTVMPANGLYLRMGPGMNYPTIALLPKGTKITALATTKDRLWVQTNWQNKIGWLRVGKIYLDCPATIADLPTATAPAAPPNGPTATATPYQIAYTPAPGQNGGGAGFNGTILVPLEAVEDGNVIFRDHMVFELRFKNKKNQDGATVQSVEITISDNNATSGDGRVYHRIENSGPYCAFGNDTNQCEKIWRFGATGYYWPVSDSGQIEQGDIPIDPDGDYSAEMSMTTSKGDTVQWFFSFQIKPQGQAKNPKPPLVANIAQTGINNTDFEVSDTLIFQVEAYDPNVGNTDGDGIDHMDLDIFTQTNQRVYHRTEKNARYCAFGDDGGDCNPFNFTTGETRWSQNGPRVQSGLYHLRATVYAQDRRKKTVDMAIELP